MPSELTKRGPSVLFRTKTSLTSCPFPRNAPIPGTPQVHTGTPQQMNSEKKVYPKTVPETCSLLIISTSKHNQHPEILPNSSTSKPFPNPHPQKPSSGSTVDFVRFRPTSDASSPLAAFRSSRRRTAAATAAAIGAQRRPLGRSEP